jgi:hypothetical protein
VTFLIRLNRILEFVHLFLLNDTALFTALMMRNIVYTLNY